MKTITCSVLALMVLGAPAFAQGPAPSKPVCIYTHDIRSSQPSRDEKSITFTMNNGDRWRNDLKARCSGIDMNGFAWTLRGGDQVCDNMQTLSVLRQGSICMIGKFTALPKVERKADKP